MNFKLALTTEGKQMDKKVLTFKEQRELEKKEFYKEALKETKELLDHKIIEVYTYAQEGYKQYVRQLQEPMYSLVKKVFRFKDLREHPVYFRLEQGGTIYCLQLRHFVTNVMMWGGVIRVDDDGLSEEHIVDASNINTKVIKNFIDKFIIIPFRGVEEQWKLNVVAHDIVYNLGRISSDMNEQLSISMDAETFINLANKFPEIDQIMHTRLSEDMQPKEIETQLNKLTKQQIEIIRDDDGYNHLKPILRSSSAIKPGQFKEFAVNAGLKLAPYKRNLVS